MQVRWRAIDRALGTNGVKRDMSMVSTTGTNVSSGNLESRLSFLEVTAEDRIVLRDFAGVIGDALEGLLDGFYAHATSVPSLKSMFRDAEHMKRARAAQGRHWLERVFAGAFDEAYLKSAVTIGKTHARIGLDPRWYIGGYGFVLTRLHRLAIEHLLAEPEKLSRVLCALDKVALLDMDIAISVYIDEAKELSAEFLRAQAERFETNVKDVVTSVSNAAAELEATAGTVAAAAEESASQSGTVSAATEECQVSIRQIKDQFQNALEFTRSAVDQAGSAETTIDGLNTSADAIGDFSKTISDIAGQTNLLALNATIEAARAGDAGKGFAVVASEVKALAQQTARATEEISSRIDTIQKEVKSTSGAISDVAMSIKKIDEMSLEISGAMGEQETAMREVASNVAGISEAATETGQATAETMAATAELAKQSTTLQTRVDEFLIEVRQAG